MNKACIACAKKLTELGDPTSNSLGYSKIAAKIKQARPDISGGVLEVFMAFLGPEECARLKAPDPLPPPKKPKKRFRKAREARKAAAIPKPAKLAAKPAKRSGGFYETELWRELRYRVMRRDKAQCAACGATPADGVIMHVDHIKPRSKFPELELDLDNLQILCEACNLGKSNTDEIDWREFAAGRKKSRVAAEDGTVRDAIRAIEAQFVWAKKYNWSVDEFKKQIVENLEAFYHRAE